MSVCSPSASSLNLSLHYLVKEAALPVSNNVAKILVLEKLDKRGCESHLLEDLIVVT